MEQKYLGFPIPKEIEAKLYTVLEKVKSEEKKSKYAMDIYDVVVDLSDAGLDYFFMKPLEEAKIGRIKLRAIAFAIKTGKKGILSVGKGIIKAMNDEQISVIVRLLEQSITVRPQTEV